MNATRTAAVLFPQWTVIAATAELTELDRPVLVIEDHRVLAVTADAAAEGVHAGMPRRTATSLVPGALVLAADHEAEGRLAELAAAAIDQVATGVDIIRAGLVSFAADGPARHWGGERELAERTIDAVADATGWECQVGVADGPLGALMAARTERIIRPGQSARFLAPFSLRALEHAAPLVGADAGEVLELVGSLERLGIRLVGDLADLDGAALSDRFGPLAARLRLLARGGELHPPAGRRLPQETEVARTCEPPLTLVDQAAFMARTMAEELGRSLLAAGCVCERLRIAAVFEDGTERERSWRHGGSLTSADIVDRIRWQCDGWLTADGTTHGPIVRLALHPEQLMPAQERATALWGTGSDDSAARRAFARIQSLMGQDAVLVPRAAGGRLLTDAAVLAPWAADPPGAAPAGDPWPGRLLGPAPDIVPVDERPVELLAADGSPVRLRGRGLLGADPVVVRLPQEPAHPGHAETRSSGPEARDRASPEDGGRSSRARPAAATVQSVPVLGWAGPWLIDQRWWDPKHAWQGARLQVLLEDGRALVLVTTENSWRIEGIYD